MRYAGGRLALGWLFFLTLAIGSTAAAATLETEFYGERLRLPYDPAMTLRRSITLDERSLVAAYRQLESAPYQLLLDALKIEAKRLDLNDWLYYCLVRRSLERLYSDAASINAELTAWLLLVKSGFDARITFRGNRAYVNVYTQDELFEVPLIEDRGRRLVNLSSIGRPYRGGQAMYLLDFVPNRAGRSFDFSLQRWPRLGARPTSRQLSFGFRGQHYQLEVKFDQQIVDVMREYPLVQETRYLRAPLSASLYQSLLPQLRAAVKTMSERDALEFITALTRSAFEYKEDKAYFGRSKPMVPDELFYYPYSDCEDRAALFYALCKEVLDLPLLILAYDDHLSAAVATAEVSGDAVNYAGRRYLFCDPTGPSNSSEIGRAPVGYENKNFEVIVKYK